MGATLDKLQSNLASVNATLDKLHVNLATVDALLLVWMPRWKNYSPILLELDDILNTFLSNHASVDATLDKF